jgi:tRNA nucleotidyltransferase (CCA-adding enzyme)
MRANIGAMVPTVIDRLTRLPGAERVLGALDGLRRVHLVGGAVRDLLLDRTPREIDLLAEEDGVAVARELARRLDGALRVHDTFGTATVEAGDLRLDVATARAETYPRPGALPEVRPGTVAEDMARRDFTVNAIAVGLTDDVRGRVTSFPGALEDLEARRLRVLHDASFVDDPTRLIRLVRYGTRLGFFIDPRTEQLARAAFADDAPATAGLARMGREFWLLLGEPTVVEGLELLDELGGGGAFHAEPAVLERVLDLLPPDASREHALLAALAADLDEDDLAWWLREAHVPRPDLVLVAARAPRDLAARLAAATTPSELAAVADPVPPEAVVVAGAFGAEEPARRWLRELRHVRPAITGRDLLDAGVPQGPEIGRRLALARAALLDGRATTREEQLAAALADASH